MTAISDKYNQLGGATGFLGSVVTAEIPAANGGQKQEFQHGTIYWHPSIGAFEIHGLIRDRWQVMGAETSLLGYPVTDESATPDGIGRYNHFEHGSIYWTSASGAHEVYGAVRARWAELRWERGLLGYPISAPYIAFRNRIAFLIAPFQNGKIEVNAVTQQVYVEKYASATSPNYSIPIVAYRVSDNNGSNPCAITAGEVRQWVDEANRVFAAAGVSFTFDGVLHDLWDTQINNLTGEDNPWWQPARDKLNRLAAQHRSVVVVHRASVGGGFSDWRYDFVAMSFFDANWLGGLAHELGHHFGLVHTHYRAFPSVREAEDFVLSGRSIDEFDGDRFWIDDTPPDPFIQSLQSETSIYAVALGGRTFSLARKNIMSYWKNAGMGELSHSQIDRVRSIVLERRRRYLNVTVLTPVDCDDLKERIESLQARLDELTSLLEPEADPFPYLGLYAQITRLRNQIRLLNDRALRAGCT